MSDVATIDGTLVPLGEVEHSRPRRLDRARRFRNDALYGDLTTAEAGEFLNS